MLILKKGEKEVGGKGERMEKQAVIGFTLEGKF